MSTSVDQLTTFLLDTLTDVKGLMVSELPEVVTQVLSFYTFKYVVIVLLCIVILLTIIRAARWYHSWYEKQTGYMDDFIAYEVGYGLAIIACIIPFSVMCKNLILLFKIYLAPKLWLIEYAATLSK